MSDVEMIEDNVLALPSPPRGLEASFQYEGSELHVNARQLHEFLEVETEFRHWITRRIEQYRFKEDRDFRSFLTTSEAGRQLKEYLLTRRMAKELCMVENNDKGAAAREYFIAIEERALALQSYGREELFQQADQLLVNTVAILNNLGAEMRRDFAETNGKIHEVATEVGENTHAIGEVKTQIGTVVEKMGEHTQAIESLTQKVEKEKRKSLTPVTVRIHIATVIKYYHHLCPNCLKWRIITVEGHLGPLAQKDHFYSKSNANLTATWIICKECNQRKEHSLDLTDVKIQFEAYQLQRRRYQREQEQRQIPFKY